MKKEEKEAIEKRFSEELAELLSKYNIQPRVARFAITRDVWNLLSRIFKEDITSEKAPSETGDHVPPGPATPNTPDPAEGSVGDHVQKDDMGAG